MLLRVVAFALVLLLVQAAFLESYTCTNVDTSKALLEPFLYKVAIDEDKQILKFLANSKVVAPDMNSRDVIISDVNSTTNRYTTLHVEIQFMGQTFINEDLRFCDVIAVKKTSLYPLSPRFDLLSSSATESAAASTDVDGHIGKRLVARNIMYNETDSLSTSNRTVEQLYSNSTGELVQCPLYVNDSIVLYYQADISDHLRLLGSYTARFSVVSNNEESTVISCSRTYVTPVQPEIVSQALNLGIPIVLLATAVINFFTLMVSPHQESQNPFLFSASAICNKDLLRQMETNVGRIILYLQFALFTAGLDLQYPGFYQPLVGQIKWCALLGISIIDRNGGRDGELDNVHTTYNRGGLKSLTAFLTDHRSIHSTWPNFIIVLLLVTVCSIVGREFILVFKLVWGSSLRKWNGTPTEANTGLLREVLVRPTDYRFFSLRNLFYMSGDFVRNFLMVFGIPFVVLTSYMFWAAGQINGKHKWFPTVSLLRFDALDPRVSYDDLFRPSPMYWWPAAALPDNAVSADALSTMTAAPTPSFLPLITGSMSMASGMPMPTGPPSNLTEVIVPPTYLRVPNVNLVFGGLLFFAWHALFLFFLFRYVISFRKWRFLIHHRASKLYTSVNTILSWESLYVQLHPSRLYYVIIEYLSLLTKGLIIGCLQHHGMVQVMLLIISEVIELLLFFIVLPYYLKVSWYSLRWMLPAARFVVTTLCIPFIRQLDLSESVRTYVSYAQLLVHLTMAVIFIIQLGYTFSCVVISIIKKRNDNKQFDFAKNYSNTSVDDFKRQFDYVPMKKGLNSQVPDQTQLGSQYDALMMGVADQSSILSEDGDDLRYYRGSNRKQDLPEKVLDSPGTAVQDGSFSFDDATSDTRPNTPRPKDYTVREADQIYRKYFVDTEIDPEIKALWDLRKWSDDVRKDEPYKQQAPAKPKRKGFFLFRKDQPQEKGFQVVRPRPLIIKTSSYHED